MSMSYDIAQTIITFCQRHKIDRYFGENLLQEIYRDLEWDDDVDADAADYFRYSWEED